MKHIFLWILAPICLLARPVDTFYGTLEVEEPVLLELIDCPAMQRLKEVHQYGVSYYTSYSEEYSRYDHSLGVFALLRSSGAPLKEQIAGLIHDVSHTVFSHVGDWVFGVEYQDTDYQNSIHSTFLTKYGVGEILTRYGYHPEEMDPKRAEFSALECELPDLCADRLDYNIQGAYHQGFLTYEEALELYHSMAFEKGVWVSKEIDHLVKLTRFSLYMTEACWGSPENHVESKLLADALQRAIDVGLITMEDLHFGTDDVIWNQLLASSDPFIQKTMEPLLTGNLPFKIVEEEVADEILTPKFRGIDPYVTLNGLVLRLLILSPELEREYEKVRKRLRWPIALKEPSVQ